jgi:hypothetical protein
MLAAGFISLPLMAQAPVVGSRSAGMGGAVTAVADDGTAVWTNPAGLARDQRIDLEVLGSFLVTNRNDFLATADRLSSLDLSGIVSRGDLPAIAAALRDLTRLAESGTGIVGSGVGGLVFGKGGFAVAIDDLAYTGVYPTIDLVRILPVNDPNLGLAFNQTGVSFAGLEAREARFSYARSFFAKVLLVGGTVRYISGRTYFVRQGVFDISSTDPLDLAREALKHNARDTSKFAFDLGAMVNILGKARIGLTSTAINEPKFAVANNPSDPTLLGAPSTIKLPRTLRAGLAAQPIGALTVALDYDLKATDVLIPGGRSRQLSAGAEFKLPLFAIRAGALRDSAAPDPHWAYSAGFGIGLNAVSLNAAVIFSTEGGLSLSSTNRRDIGAGLDARVRF